MKILFIQPTCDKKGHYGKYTLNLCQELARLGNEVILFTNRAEPVKFLKEKPLFRILEYKEGAFSFAKFDEARKTKPWLYLWGYLRNSFVIFKAALNFAKKEKFDVIQVTDVEFGILSFLLVLRNRGAAQGGSDPPCAPVVLLMHAANFSFSKYPGNIIFRLYKVLQREILRTRLGKEIKAIVTLGEYHKEELQKQFHLPANFPIKVIYDGAEPPEFYLSKNEARQKLGIDYAGPIFLLFGVLRKDKGIEYLLEAARILDNKKPASKADSLETADSSVVPGSSPMPIIANHKTLSSGKEKYDNKKPWTAQELHPSVSRRRLENRDYPPPTAELLYQKNPKSKVQNQKENFKILIVGSPFDYEPKEISDMVMELGLADRVILRLGYVSDEEIPLYFFAADCVVFPYKKIYTGGTGPLLKEAAMHKKPVIVSNVSEMGRLVAKKQMGLVAEPENAADLAGEMAEFLQTPELQRKKWGENAFAAANTWQKMANQYLQLYEQISQNN